MNYDSYRGVFNTDVISCCTPTGELGLPAVHRVNATPNRLISFDKAIGSKDTNRWVHFFIHDRQFKRLLNDPWRYLPILARFNGVIAPDFSVFWQLPLYIQIQSIGKSREICSWLRESGVTVIPFVRWGKSNTYKYAFGGIEPGGTAAVGTVGCMREKQTRIVFEEGFPEMLKAVEPNRVIVYGSARSHVFSEARDLGVEIMQFDSSTSEFFKKRGA